MAGESRSIDVGFKIFKEFEANWFSVAPWNPRQIKIAYLHSGR